MSIWMFIFGTQEFKKLAKQAAACSHVLDFIPLREIKCVDFEVLKKDRETNVVLSPAGARLQKKSDRY